MSLRGYSNLFGSIDTTIAVNNFLVGFITGLIIIVCAAIFHLQKIQTAIDLLKALNSRLVTQLAAAREKTETMDALNSRLITKLAEARVKIEDLEATIIENRVAALRRQFSYDSMVERTNTEGPEASGPATPVVEEPEVQPPSYESPPAYRTRVEVPPVPYVRGAENDRGRVVHPIVHYDIIPPMAIVALLNHIDNLYDAPNASQRRIRDRIIVLLKHFIAEVENEKLYCLSLVENITRLLSAYGYYDVNGQVAFGGLEDRTSPLAKFTKLASVVKPWCLNEER